MEIIIKKCIFFKIWYFNLNHILESVAFQQKICVQILTKAVFNYIFRSLIIIITHRKISPIKWMDDKGFIAQMHNTRDSITCLESSHGPRNKLTARKVFDRSVVIAMLNVLLRYWNSSFFQKFPLPNIGCKQSPIIMGIIKIIKCHNSFESKTIVKQQCS